MRDGIEPAEPKEIPPDEVQLDSAEIPANEVKVDQPEIPHDEVKMDTPEGGIPDNEVKLDSEHEKYGSPVQQGITALEGAAKGASFGLSTKLETMAGVDPNDIKGRQAENPLVAIGSEAAGTIGSMFVPGVGEGWLLGKAGNAVAHLAIPVEKANNLAKIGRLALRGMFETSGMATGDEISDAFLDKGHDASAVASHIATAGGVGLLTGGVQGVGKVGLEAIQNQMYGKYLDDFAIGLGHASNGGSLEDLKAMHEMVGDKLPKGIEQGHKFYTDFGHQVIDKAASKAAQAIGGGAGSAALGSAGYALAGTPGMLFGGPAGAKIGYEIAKKTIDPFAEKLVSKVSTPLVKNVMTPMMLTALKQGEYRGLTRALDYGIKASRGANAIKTSLDSLFKVGTSKPMEFEINQKDNDKLHKYIEDGGIDQQMDQIQDEPDQAFAEGGIVQPKPISSDGVSRLYPAQHMMMTAAKTRVSNYLNSVRPAPPLDQKIFDHEHKDPVKERSYQSALNIANKPLSILKHIQDGTLDMEKMKHFAGMYPEVHDHLSKKITERLVDHKTDETKPSYKVRQGLSLFLGAPLESLLTPQSIIAAQGTFSPKQQPQQQQQAQKKAKKGTAPLSKASKDYKTTTQEAESDRSARN